MELEKIYQAIITGRAMLITGSGAHIAYCEAKRPDLRSKTVAFRF